MSTQKREFSKKRRNGTMRKKMKGGVWYNPMTWNSSSAASTAEVPAEPVVDASDKPKQSFYEIVFGKNKLEQGASVDTSAEKPKPSFYEMFFGKKKETVQAVAGQPVTGQPNQAGGKRKNKRSRNSKK